MPSTSPPVQRVPEQAHLAAFQILFILNHFLELPSNPRLGPAVLRIKWWRPSEGATSDQFVMKDGTCAAGGCGLP